MTNPVQVGEIEKKMKQWGAKLDGYVAKAKKTGAEIKADEAKTVAELKVKHKVVQSKLDELKAAGEDQWAFIKTSVEMAYDDFEGAVKKLFA